METRVFVNGFSDAVIKEIRNFNEQLTGDQWPREVDWPHDVPRPSDQPQRLAISWYADVTATGEVWAVVTVHYTVPYDLRQQIKNSSEFQRPLGHLRENIAQFLPPWAVDVEKYVGESYGADPNMAIFPLWGYISEVRAYRAALMDELAKPL